jgi:hypothetical protein
VSGDQGPCKDCRATEEQRNWIIWFVSSFVLLHCCQLWAYTVELGNICELWPGEMHFEVLPENSGWVTEEIHDNLRTICFRAKNVTWYFLSTKLCSKKQNALRRLKYEMERKTNITLLSRDMITKFLKILSMSKDHRFRVTNSSYSAVFPKNYSTLLCS